MHLFFYVFIVCPPTRGQGLLSFVNQFSLMAVSRCSKKFFFEKMNWLILWIYAIQLFESYIKWYALTSLMVPLNCTVYTTYDRKFQFGLWVCGKVQLSGYCEVETSDKRKDLSWAITNKIFVKAFQLKLRVYNQLGFIFTVMWAAGVSKHQLSSHAPVKMTGSWLLSQKGWC